MGHQNKRRIYYLKNTAQTKFIVRFLVVSLVGGLFAVTAFNLLAAKKIDAVLYSMRMPKVTAGGLLWNEMLYTNIFVAVFVILVFIWTARGLFVKVHGPLKKLTSDLSKVTCGELSLKVSLREKDEFKDVAEELNTAISGIRQRVNDVRAANDRLLACVEVQDSTGGRPDLGQVRESLQELTKAMGSFTL